MSNKKTINLYVENESGGEDVVAVTIKKMKFRQLETSLGILMQVVQVLESEPKLREAFTKIFNQNKGLPTAEDLENLATMSDEQLDELAVQKKQERDTFIVKALFESLKTLLVYLPRQGLELLAAISKIDVELLYEQELETTIFEVVDAIFEVNDVQAIIERGKQSFGVAKSRMAFLIPAEKN